MTIDTYSIPFIPTETPLYLTYPLRTKASAWLPHVPFGMYLIDAVRPRVLVELGVYMGVSFCAFCQIAKALALETKFYGIDTWRGDRHVGAYGSEILDDLRAHHDPLYGSFSTLIKSTFSEAASHFENGSVDLVHIDGYHIYEAVRQDFQDWLPKMSSRGVMIFHDTNVKERDFGVWKFWKEVTDQYPHFEFLHGSGLGLLVVGDDCPEKLKPLLAASDSELTKFREYFYQLGLRVAAAQELSDLKWAYKIQTGALTSQSHELEELKKTVIYWQQLERRKVVRWVHLWAGQGWRGVAKVLLRKLYSKKPPQN